MLPKPLASLEFSDSVRVCCVCCATSVPPVVCPEVVHIPHRLDKASALSQRGQMPSSVNMSLPWFLRCASIWQQGRPTVAAWSRRWVWRWKLLLVCLCKLKLLQYQARSIRCEGTAELCLHWIGSIVPNADFVSGSEKSLLPFVPHATYSSR